MANNPLTKVGVISLGCPKNLVDTEVMMGLINNSGYVITHDESDADVVLINTCGFIDASQRESVRTVLETAATGKKVIMAGCLLERFRGDIEKQMPEVSAFIGTNEITNIVNVLDGVTGYVRKNEKLLDYFSAEFEVPRYSTSFATYSYVKISEGCDHPCTFCIIPKLRGKNRSRPISSIVQEITEMANNGVKEVVLVGQDLTAYGHDTADRKNNDITALLKELVKIPDSPYYRLLYTYPGTITQELLELIAKEEKILSYIDMPLQHSQTDVLKSMKRPFNEEKIEDLLSRMRKTIPDLVLRTTFIVGFPNETDEQFDHLCDFVKRHKFEHLGVFTYSKEDGTPGGQMENQVAHKTKVKRRKELMIIQQAIVEENNKLLMGKTLPMFVEGCIPEKGQIYGRTYRDAPEIDGFTTVKGDAQPGDIVNIKINKVRTYDTFGELV
ncbi:MAG: 30S ribosomal protein S12 methylthiotransferase RimO [Candidatus Sericytochromatia bacterium]|nr:30S ribosomal protein S12 methylthiotransferase RimO [Candidatus Sericytochromatia bacterium]